MVSAKGAFAEKRLASAANFGSLVRHYPTMALSGDEKTRVRELGTALLIRLLMSDMPTRHPELSRFRRPPFQDSHGEDVQLADYTSISDSCVAGGSAGSVRSHLYELATIRPSGS